MKFNKKNLTISKNAHIGSNVKIGDNTTIYDNVIIEDNSIICNDCVIGEPISSYYTDVKYQNPETSIGSNSLVRSHTIIYSGSTFGENFSTGHRATIREYSTFGSNCRVGTLSDVQGYVKIGDYCWLHSNVFISQNSSIGNFVFIFPHVVFTDDPHPPSNICKGPTINDFSQISAGAVILPDIKIGKHCLIGAHSLVNKNVDNYSLIVGNPGKRIKDVRELELNENSKSHYPWPNSFERGMPWEKIGFETWKKKNGYQYD